MYLSVSLSAILPSRKCKSQAGNIARSVRKVSYFLSMCDVKIIKPKAPDKRTNFRQKLTF